MFVFVLALFFNLKKIAPYSEYILTIYGSQFSIINKPVASTSYSEEYSHL